MSNREPEKSDAHAERVHALLQEAVSLQRSGDLRRARRLCRRVLDVAPGDPEANDLMGILWLQSGRPADAVPALHRAAAVPPDRPGPHYHLGVACLELGQPDAARSHFARAVELQPDHADAQVSLGDSERILGHPERAVLAYERVLSQHPGHLEALSGLGFAELARGAHDKALNAFQRALDQQPKHARSLSGYAEVLMAQRRYREAAKWLSAAMEKAPQSAALHNDLGAVFSRLGKAAAAVDQFSHALRINPVYAQARFNLGLTLEQFGYLEDAEKTYLETLRGAPDFAEAHFRLAHLPGHRSSAREMDAMRTLLNRETTPLPARVQLAFALGHACESAGDFEAAFDFMREGHRLQASANPFSLQQAVQAFATTRSFFGRRQIASLQAGGIPDERPVLLLAMPRAGATLLEQILATHPLVHVGSETGLLDVAVTRLAGADTPSWPHSLQSLTQARLRQEAEAYLAGLEQDAGAAQRLVDRSPLNFFNTGLAAMLLPDARFIHLRRDPIDTGLSIYRELLGPRHNYAHDLQDLGHFYQLYDQLMAHWSSVLGSRMLEVHYEELVRAPETQIRRILEFCGLPQHPGCLAFHERERMVRSPAAAQVRQPLYDSSIGAWRRYERSLQPLLEALESSIPA